MSRFAISETSLADLKVVERTRVGDDRGFLARVFCLTELREAGWHRPVAQVNHTHTQHRGTVRGMHFQRAPHAEMKLVACVRGAAWDVAVDLRAGSATFLRWHAQEISAANQRSLLIPEGFAHGFQALSDDCELLYVHSMAYNPESEAGLNPTDPRLAIAWPLPISHLSRRDQQCVMLSRDYRGERP